MKGGYHLKFTQYLKILTLNKGGGGTFLNPGGIPPPPLCMLIYINHYIM